MGAPAVTDSVRVACPVGTTAESVSACYSKFGEIASVKVTARPRTVANITFFDMRAAALALAGPAKSRPAPVFFTERVVRVPGSLQVDEADYQRICNVKQGVSDSNCFDIEFFDIRDADRYRAKVEAAATEGPGGAKGGEGGAQENVTLEPPPGLELPLGLEPPPGLSLDSEPAPKATEAPPVAPIGFTVEITGLPNMMLSDMMMETILQQAGLEDDVLQCTFELGKDHGKAVLQLATISAIECCKRHFKGRQWHPSVPVNVVVPVEEAVAKALLERPSMALPAADPATLLAAAACSGLTAAIPSWKPLSAKTPAFQPAVVPPTSFSMSAEAPEFVPGRFVASVPSSAAAPATPLKVVTKGSTLAGPSDSSSTQGPGSESSTEAGDSEAEDEKIRAEETTAV